MAYCIDLGAKMLPIRKQYLGGSGPMRGQHSDLDVPTLHVSVRVASVGPRLVVRSLHLLAAVTAVTPTDPGQRSLLVEESDVGHLVR